MKVLVTGAGGNLARVVVPALAAAGHTPRLLDFRPIDTGHEGLHTPVVPVVIGDDWKAALLWKALYDAGCYVYVAMYPARWPISRSSRST